MSASIKILVRTLLQKESLEQCSVRELQQLAEQYPYFDAAQLLLAKKISGESGGQGENSEQYKEQLQKTLLFFQNPLWLEHLLTDSTNGATIEAASIDNAPALPVVESSAPAQDKIEEMKEQIAVAEIVTEPAIAVVNEEPEPVNQIAGPEWEATEIIIQPVADIKDEEAEPDDELSGLEWESAEVPEQQAVEPAFEIPSLKIEAIDPAKAQLSFEPYHTVDYFASQGIKFNNEEGPKDKFGKQLKSFTEWLRAMKRLPDSAIEETKGENPGPKVEELAEHSLADREVITEAMAEVWKKQGNKAKAIEVYSKLSLLDPSKSRYFADIIDLLK